MQFENWNLATLTSRVPDAPLLRWRQRVTNHNQADFVLLAGVSKGIQVGDGDYLESRLLQNRLPHIGEFWVFRGNEDGTSWLACRHNPKVLQKLKTRVRYGTSRKRFWKMLE